LRESNRCLPGSKQWKKHLGNWRMYAAAGGASLAAATDADADADVAYQYVNQTISVTPSQHTTQFSLQGVNGHTIKFRLTNNFKTSNGSTQRSGKAVMTGIGAGGISFFTTAPGPQSLKNYARSAIVGGSTKHNQQGFLTYHGTRSLGAGKFGSGYVGFRTFTSKTPATTGGGRLGWVKVNVIKDSAGYATAMKILGVAYERTPGTSLKTGVPEPGSMAMGLLAMGATGLIALRRAKAAVAQ